MGRPQRTDPAELIALHQPADAGVCRCDRLLPCPVALAARESIQRRISQPAIGRAPVVRYWQPRWSLMARAATSMRTSRPASPENSTTS